MNETMNDSLNAPVKETKRAISHVPIPPSQFMVILGDTEPCPDVYRVPFRYLEKVL